MWEVAHAIRLFWGPAHARFRVNSAREQLQLQRPAILPPVPMASGGYPMAPVRQSGVLSERLKTVWACKAAVVCAEKHEEACRHLLSTCKATHRAPSLFQGGDRQDICLAQSRRGGGRPYMGIARKLPAAGPAGPRQIRDRFGRQNGWSRRLVYRPTCRPRSLTAKIVDWRLCASSS